MIGDVIPYVEKTYRTLTDPDNRALGGLSMGGGQTIAIGFTHQSFPLAVIMSAGAQNADHTYSDFSLIQQRPNSGVVNTFELR